MSMRCISCLIFNLLPFKSPAASQDNKLLCFKKGEWQAKHFSLNEAYYQNKCRRQGNLLHPEG